MPEEWERGPIRRERMGILSVDVGAAVARTHHRGEAGDGVRG